MPGRDRRARRIDPRPGTAAVTGQAPRVAVAGGGIAGLSAATVLAERGVRVVLYERREELGGRLAGWPTRLADGSPVTMSRGFHAFFRQYYNLRALLRRADPRLRTLAPLPDYPLRHSRGHGDSFAGLPRTPPWNALGFVARSPTFGWRGLAGMRPRAALRLLDVRVPDVYRRLDGVSAQDFLREIRFPPDARHLAFSVFSRSFFSAPGELSAAELALMFHIYFLGSAEGLLFDVPDEPFPAALWDPLERYLRERLGVEIRTGSAVESVLPRGERGLLVGCGSGAGSVSGSGSGSGSGEELYDAVVLAADVAGLRALVARSPGLGGGPWRERVAAARTAPPFLVSRLWLDRPVAAERPGFLGTGGYGELDNVSVLERWEGEAARWAARTGGSVVELHAYALDPLDDPAAVRRRLVGQLHQVYPETRRAEVVDVRDEWRADCPLFPVGGYPDRPEIRTGDPRVVAAGDAVRVELPVALMERAATTGFLAANALLERWGVRGEPVWTVPPAGRPALFRALARLS